MKKRFPSFYTRSSLRIGVLGGAFNPPHEGHVYISEEALKRLKLDAVWWLVTPQHPIKNPSLMLPLDERYALSVQQAGRCPAITVTTLEEHFGTQYTFDTLQCLQKRYPSYRFVWLMGADNLVQFPDWYRWRDIIQQSTIAIYDRGDERYKALAGMTAVTYKKHRLAGRMLYSLAYKKAPAWGFFPLRRHPASSTALRQKPLTQ